MIKKFIFLILTVGLLGFSSQGLSSDCSKVIDTFFASQSEQGRVFEVRSKLERHIDELEEELFDDEDIVEELMEEGLYVEKASHILECPLCTASSVSLKFMLEEDPYFKSSNISLRLTKSKVGDSKFHHYYLILKDYLGDGEDLIIDPTIRQFFVFRQERDIIDTQIPKVFVGSKKQLRVLFEKFGPTDSSVSYEQWVKSYLETREQPVN